MSGLTDRMTIAEIRSLLRCATGERLTQLASRFSDDPRSGVVAAVAAACRREEARLAEVRRLEGLYTLEAELRSQGFMVVAGVDEVGRGALAGPLTAGACVLPATPRIPGLDDSKRLTPARREELSEVIRGVAVSFCVGHATPDEVDSLGVTRALKRAMGRALAGLEHECDHVVLDGLPLGIAANETAVVKGDSSVAAIAAASILAKVERDRLMRELAEDHPAYGFDINKGYGTPEHLQALATHGPSTIHRKTFCPGGGADTLF